MRGKSKKEHSTNFLCEVFPISISRLNFEIPEGKEEIKHVTLQSVPTMTHFRSWVSSF